MVRGLDKFKAYFENHPQSYIIIGGTALDIIIRVEGFKPRATKDIDIILVVEALNAAFVKQFWNFIFAGEYAVREKSDSERQYYRFKNPGKVDFPYQIELFSRTPDILDIPEQSRYTPIPVDEDITSLSAILMNENYYHFTTEGSYLEEGIRIAAVETLICLKARAFIDLKAALARGEKIDADKVNKHKLDVFRLAVFLPVGNLFDLPQSIKDDLQLFVNGIANELPDKAIFVAMGQGNLNPQNVFNQIIKSFQLDGK